MGIVFDGEELSLSDSSRLYCKFINHRTFLDSNPTTNNTLVSKTFLVTMNDNYLA